MTDATDPATAARAGQIISALADWYSKQGYLRVAVPAGTLLSVVPEREHLEQALGLLIDQGAVVAEVGTGVALHPSSRLALLSRVVLERWIDKASRENERMVALHRDGIAAELARLVTWANAAELPDDLALRGAELAGVLATRDLDPAAMDAVAAHGGTPAGRLAVLAATAQRSVVAVPQLRDLMFNAVSTQRRSG